jgi:release factor glutamine methyltransferase
VSDAATARDVDTAAAEGGAGREHAIAQRRATAQLAAAGVVSARADAERLAGHVLGLGRGELVAAALAGRRFASQTEQAFDDLVALRAERVPLQHLTGRAPFRTLELEVGPGVFVPRPETETVAGLAIDEALTVGLASRGGPVVVDLCTGSAAIALAVAVEVPAARVVALEREPHALAWAERNVAAVAPGRVELRAGDVTALGCGVLEDLAGGVDVVVANPPYIPAGAVPLDPEVAEHDPEAALYGGGTDGLTVPRAVVATAAVLLVPGGLLVMEHGDAQGAACRALASGPTWVDVRTASDLTGRDRALVARWAGPA